MRNSSEWYQPLAKALEPFWPQEQHDVNPSLLCQVELGLYLIDKLDPSRDAHGVYTLLGGYPFAVAAGIATTPAQSSQLDAARHLLWKLRRRRMWHQCLETYAQLPERLRGYRLPGGGGPARRVEPTVAGDRFARFERALSRLPDFDQRVLPPAPAGQARFTERHRPASVTIPEQLCFPPATGHDLGRVPGTAGRPLDIPLAELAETARWMEESETARGLPCGNWVQRLEDLELDVLAVDGLRFEKTTVLRLDQLLHLVGMVGAGKSTLMNLIAVWGARKGLRTTLGVGDVAEQLNLVGQFRDLGLKAAPVIGGTTREQHASRLHRRLAARGQASLLQHDDPAFDDLSTVCVLDAQRGLEAAEPLRYVDAPCTELRPVKKPVPTTVEDIPMPVYRHDVPEGHTGESTREAEPETSRSDHGCPVWSVCPRHATDRELVDALIWVANPASLLQSAVPNHLNAERLRHLELACLRSDIVIVDEADRVQMQLDTAFAPSATLIVRGPDSWLDRLGIHKIDELARQGRLPLSARDVERWSASLDIVHIAANRLYRRLITDDDLRKWADIEYFSAWTLQEKLVNQWYPRPRADGSLPDGISSDAEVYDSDDESDGPAFMPRTPGTEPWDTRRNAVTEALDTFRDDPLGDRGPHSDLTDTLIRRAGDLLHNLDQTATSQRVRSVLDTLLTGSPLLDGSLRQEAPEPGKPARDPVDTWGTEPWLEREARRLEFTLVLAALHQRLERVTFLWPQAEAALHLDTADNELSRRPPLDYAPVVPEAPMGNVLGFQYLPEDPERGPDGDEQRSGTLRFFRCAGVGRELLLNLPALGADSAAGRPGPHVLLMSGTSWAGTSTRAHVMAPVKAILKPHQAAVDSIRRTRFTTLFLYDGEGTPLTLSGAKLDTRERVLAQMVTQLGKSAPGSTSRLDRELRRIEDGERRRALLLVGSYQDARVAADLLERMPRWRGKVRVLASDKAELDHTGPGDTATGDFTGASAVRRGDLAAFAKDEDAEVLVAPLMAIERGHNILNQSHKAAFGTVLFLARPHPRPDDLSLAVFAVNDWVTRFVRDQPDPEAGTFGKLVADAANLDAAGLGFRLAARKEWRRLLSRRYIYSRLSDAEKTSFAWDQLVTIWQVIGRLVRGGVPARVVFVDAAFAPALAEAGAPPAAATRSGRWRNDDGLLIKLRDVLAPYFDDETAPESFPDPADPALVRTLYHPLYDALCGLSTGN
ncbi:pPIWI_RE_Z domain-containing protein [Streptomyces platensis]|uniref:pPIWI_RE_Z domain-containing protein n=1 Tax=Streptomyces platensis TaxID=58346 RepID=UPI0036C316D3